MAVGDEVRSEYDGAEQPNTPEGFAEFKAATLNLTPLEVLKCFDRLSKRDQSAVLSFIDKRAAMQAEVEQLSQQEAELKARRLRMEKNVTDAVHGLEAHHPDVSISADQPIAGSITARNINNSILSSPLPYISKKDIEEYLKNELEYSTKDIKSRWIYGKK